jgi:choline monooxygenase
MTDAIPVRERLRSEIERFDPQLDIEMAKPPPGAWYTDARFLELEQHTTFSRHWQFVGRSDQVGATGSFFTGTVLNRPYLVVRDEDDELRAFYNVCAHHGTKVASGCGSASEFTCPYHGWQYHLSGGLKRAPRAGAVEAFRKRTVGLKPLPVITWGPFVLVHFGTPSHLDGIETERESLAMESLRFVAQRVFDLPCNWKVFVDNYVDGGYHVPLMHKDLTESLEIDAYSSRLGDGYSVQTCPSKGGRLGDLAKYLFVHPNFMINRYGSWMDTNLVLPDGPDRCTVVFDYYHDGPLDEKVLARALDDSKQVQQEDTEIVSLVQEGLASGAYEGLYAPRFEQPMLQFHRMLAADFAAQAD